MNPSVKIGPPTPPAERKLKVSLKQAAEKKALMLEALSYIGRFKDKIVVIKYGGSAQVDVDLREGFLQDIALLHSLGMRPVIVHGGGPEISRMMKQMGLKPSFAKGLRVSTPKTLEIAEMVLSGSINKDLAARLSRFGACAVGISGKDGDPLVLASKSPGADGVDLGLVGKIEVINPRLIHLLLDNGCVPIISPIGVGEDGQTYNINADSVASRIASALKAEKIVFMTDVDGVMHEGKLLSRLNATQTRSLITQGIIQGGMVPKIEAALHCLEHDVRSIQMINGKEAHAIISELFTEQGIGSMIVRV